MKKSTFKLKSGNKPSVAKLSGSSPMKIPFLDVFGPIIAGGIKNVWDKRGKKFQYTDKKGDLYETSSGVIPTSKYQAKKIKQNFITGYKKAQKHINKLIKSGKK